MPTLLSWSPAYLDSRKDLAPWTRYLHSLTLRRLADFFGLEGRPQRICEHNPDHASAFRLYLEGLGLSPASVAIEIRNAKTIYGRAVKRKVIESNPFEGESGMAPEPVQDWPEVGDAEMDRLLKSCRGYHYRCLFALARWGGLRRGECCRLRWADIDWDARTLEIKAPVITTKRRPRMVPICPKLYAELLAAKSNGGDGPCSGCSPYPRNLARAVQATMRRARFPKMRRPLHDLRRCRSTELFDRFPPLTAAKWMGHGPQVAAKYYVRPTRQAIEAVTGGREDSARAGDLGSVLAKLAAIEAKLKDAG